MRVGLDLGGVEQLAQGQEIDRTTRCGGYGVRELRVRQAEAERNDSGAVEETMRPTLCV